MFSQDVDLFEQFGRDLEEKLTEYEGVKLTIIEFAEKEVDLGIELTLQQKLILKAFYNLPLTEEETSILEYWVAAEKCTWDPERIYQILVLESGRRSGKTSIAALIAVYEFYLLCRLRSPQLHYGIASSTPISILVLATTASQGKKTIFKNVIGTVNQCRYFQLLKEQGKLFVGKEEITYEEKLLYIYSGNSQSASQVGGTMKTLIMDEVARFKDSDGDSNALELWSNLGIATTTFKEDARRVAISSAWYEGDAIEQLYEASRNDPVSLGIRTKSWELNPIHASRDNPVVASEYARDPVKASLEFEGIRPSAVDAFLNADEVRRAFTGKSVIAAQPYTAQEGDYKLVKINIEKVEPFGKYSTALHIDPALGSDAYALAFGHSEFDDRERLIVVVDGILAWEPTHEAQVSITDVQDAILTIHDKRPISKLTADHYNSAETIQRLRRQGISCDIEFFSNRTQVSMYDLVRVLLHEQRLILPADSPWTPLALRELCKVQLVKGNKITHPSNSSKDVADAVASICWTLASRTQRDLLTSAPSIKSATMQTQSGSWTRSEPTIGKPYQPGQARQLYLQLIRNKRK